MARIFISYRRDDSAGYAGRLYDRLGTDFGADNLFMDIAATEPGVDFADAIEQAVSGCDILLAVIGRQWLTITDGAGRRRLENPDDFVRLEIAAALKRNIRVIPVLVQGAAMPHAEQLPEPLKPLTRRQAQELSDGRWQYDIDRLLTVLKKVLQSQELDELVAQFAQAEAQEAGDDVIAVGERILQVDAQHQPTRSKTALAYNNRANSYHHKREYDKAIADCTRAIELNPNFAAAYYNRGVVYKRRNEAQAARRDFERAAALGLEDAKKALLPLWKRLLA